MTQVSRRPPAPGALSALSLHVATCAALAVLLISSRVQAGWAGMTRLVTGAGGITTIAQPPSDPDRLFIGTRDGAVQVLHLAAGYFQPELFLNVLLEVEAIGEGGLLGLAFHPDYQTNGKFYVSMTVDNGGVVVVPGTETTPALLSPFTMNIREYRASADPNFADRSGYTTVLSWVKPYVDHNGGWLGFGPDDGYLYVATGDGGGTLDAAPGHTPGIGNAQDITDNVMGKLLRLDVDRDDFPGDADRNYGIPPNNPFVGREGDDEIFANGLRNPWRASFDRATGDMWIGDVGDWAREEVNFIPAGSAGGQNFGWRLREGANPHPDPTIGGSPPPRNVHPVYDYAHLGIGVTSPFQGNSVIGGYVYRGPDPELQGKYVFADFVSRKIWMFDPADPYGTVTNITPQLAPDVGTLEAITTLFEDSVGNLYLGTLTGNVFRLETDALTPGDFQGDAIVDASDLAIWRANYAAQGTKGPYAGDADGDSDVDGSDFLAWQRHLGWSAAGRKSTLAAGNAAPEPGASSLLIAAAVGAALAMRGGRRPRRLRAPGG